MISGSRLSEVARRLYRKLHARLLTQIKRSVATGGKKEDEPQLRFAVPGPRGGIGQHRLLAVSKVLAEKAGAKRNGSQRSKFGLIRSGTAKIRS